MKALYLLFVILLCSSSLYGENLSTLAELEQLQEKLWYLQRDLGKIKTSIEQQQKQLNLLESGINKEQKQVSEHLSSLTRETEGQKERAGQMENDLEQLSGVLVTLTADVRQVNNVLLGQAGQIHSLENSIEEIRDKRNVQQTDTGQELRNFREQIAEVQAKTVETRYQFVELEKTLGEKIKELGYWGAGAAMLFSIILAFVILLLRSRTALN